MKSFAKPLRALTAADLMKQPVVTIPQEMTLRSAAGLLQREQISGAPVIDSAGRCVGVLSATDFMKSAAREGKGKVPCPNEPCFSDWQVIDVAELPSDEVRAYMSRDVVTAMASTSVAELARTMLDAHIHRVFVVDGQRRPVGVVSSTDIIAAVAYAEIGEVLPVAP
jgi:CBS-domain-containing membrane protein